MEIVSQGMKTLQKMLLGSYILILLSMIQTIANIRYFSKYIIHFLKINQHTKLH